MTEPHPNAMIHWPSISCLRDHDTHTTFGHRVDLSIPNAYTDCPPVPGRFHQIAFDIQLWDYDAVGGPGHPYCPQADAVSETIHRYGVWEPRESVAMLLAFEAVSRENSPWTFVDVGAHLGWYGMLAHHFGAEVRAVEADPEVVTVLKSNLGSAVVVHDKRIGPRSKMLDPSLVHGLVVAKVDIEGAEPAAIRWLKRLLDAERVEYLMLEVSPVFDGGYGELLVALFERGFEMGLLPEKSRPPKIIDSLDDLEWITSPGSEWIDRWLAGFKQTNVLMRLAE